MLSKINKRANSVLFHFYEVPKAVTFLQTECIMVVARVAGRGDRELLFSGYRSSG